MEENRKSIKAVMLISGILYCASQAVILKILHPLGLPSVRRFQLSFDRQSVAAILEQWGEQGIAIFKTSFYLDFFHPALYSVFLFSTLLFIRNSSGKHDEGKSIPLPFYLPFIAAFADIVENFIELSITNDFAGAGDYLFFCNGLVSSIKWSLAALSLAMIAVTGFRALAARRHGGR